MARYALVRRVMIGAPSDAADLSDLAIEAVHRWNRARHLSHELLEPIHWRLHSHPAFNPNGGQAELNTQLVLGSDILIAIFRCRLGTPTLDYPSGTAEEISLHVKNGRPVMAYFSLEPVARDIDRNELERLEQFKRHCNDLGVMGQFKDSNDFKDKVYDELNRLVSRHPINVVTKIREAGNQSHQHMLEIQRDKDRFEFERLSGKDTNIRLRCVTFRPQVGSAVDPGVWWLPVNDFEVDPNSSLKKSEIVKQMEHPRDSFKFYLNVRNDREEIVRYRTLLADSDAVVTGYGSKSWNDPNFWRIWFLHPEGFIHPYMARSYLANHSIVDLSGL